MCNPLSAPESQPPLTLIAVGSDIGADVVAWRVAEHLGLDHQRCRSPITELPGMLSGRSDVVILDALLAAPGDSDVAQLLDLDEARAATPATASHGLSVIDTLRLIAEFDYLPARVDLIGLPIYTSQTSVTAPQIESLSAQVHVLLARRHQSSITPAPKDIATVTNHK
ncbi:MAG: hypothetical protein KDI42_01245 [Gammaproteobacteria bacterium]|nr:hypothetical protein [Gammaproteobacteria bacterium]